MNRIVLNVIYLAALVVLLGLTMKQCSENSRAKEDADRLLKAIQEDISYYKTTNGRLVAEKITLEGTRSQLKSQIDSFSRAFSEKPKNIQSGTTVTTNSHTHLNNPSDSVKIVYQDKDTCKIRYMEGSFSDPWNKVKVRLGEGSFIDMVRTDTARVLMATEKRGKWPNRYEVISTKVLYADTGVKVTSINAFKLSTLKDRRKWIEKGWGIGVSTGWYQVGNRGGFGVGIGVTKNIINF